MSPILSCWYRENPHQVLFFHLSRVALLFNWKIRKKTCLSLLRQNNANKRVWIDSLAIHTNPVVNKWHANLHSLKIRRLRWQVANWRNANECPGPGLVNNSAGCGDKGNGKDKQLRPTRLISFDWGSWHVPVIVAFDLLAGSMVKLAQIELNFSQRHI